MTPEVMMTIPDILTVAGLADAYRSGALTPRDVVATVAERIAARSSDAVWITLDLERAAAQAEALGGEPGPSPLWGVPFAVKDNIDVAGWPTTAACPAVAHVADETATAVQRLLDAGSILIGKTNLDQFATGLNGTRSPYGAPRAVHDETMISGGSSSGSAVAVAAGVVAFSLGTDTAGSGRVPASLNGLVAHKPSRGLVSTFGVLPACRSLDCVSVFAQTVDDTTVVLDAISGPDVRDHWSRDLPMPVPAALEASSLRLAVPAPEDLALDARHGYDVAWRDALDSLREAGAVIEEIDMAPFFEAGGMLYQGPWIAERDACIEPFRPADEEMDPTVRSILAGAAHVTGQEVFRAQDQLRRLQSDVRRRLSGFDALLTPTVETTFSVAEMMADPVAANAALGRFTTSGNLLDLTVAVVPAPTARTDRPFGVSISGIAGSDAVVLGVAMSLEALFSDAPPPSPRDEVPAPALPLAVVGAHLSGMPLHHQLADRGAVLVRRTRTSADYRLVALPTVPPKPGLVRVAPGTGSAIEVEVYDLPMDTVGSFLLQIAAPLGLGSVTLEDGATVHGFTCEAIAAESAPDISAYGGWRAYLAAR